MNVRLPAALLIVTISYIAFSLSAHAAKLQTQSEVAALIYGKKLRQAVTDRKVDEIKRLIDFGADVNLRDEEGRTPLMLAVLYQQPDTIDMLLLAGADPTVVDSYGESAVDLAFDGHEKSKIQGNDGSADRFERIAVYLRDEILPIWKKAQKEENERLQQQKNRERLELWTCLSVDYDWLGQFVVRSYPPAIELRWQHIFSNSCAHDIYVVWQKRWWAVRTSVQFLPGGVVRLRPGQELGTGVMRKASNSKTGTNAPAPRIKYCVFRQQPNGARCPDFWKTQ